MEDILRALFDYQRFVGNASLNKIISDTESRYGAIISDDELESVSAAGENVPPQKSEEQL